MKRTLILLSICLASIAYGHGVDADVAGAGSGAIVVQMKYHEGEPMALVPVSIFSPSSPETELLSGLTDRNGRYAFVPDEEGEWRVEARDGLGHMASVSVKHALSAPISDVSHDAATPDYILALLGVSLILNLFALYYLVKKRYAHK